jgi:diguanylate cyclase (GGDEF)-like protein/PAS domain S-box-containing protein
MFTPAKWILEKAFLHHPDMRRTHFLSLKWKAIGLTSFILFGTVLSISLFSYLNLKRQFDHERLVTHQNYRRNLQALIDESFLRLEDLAHLIPYLHGMRQALASGNRSQLRSVFDFHWGGFQIATGLDFARFYDHNSAYLAGWDQTGLSESDPVPAPNSVSLANQEEKPVTVLKCHTTCRQYVIVPLLTGRQHNIVVVLGTSLTNVILNFRRISGADVGLLMNNKPPRPNISPPVNYLSNWNAHVIALTNFSANYPLLTRMSKVAANFDDIHSSLRIRYQNSDYEGMILSLPANDNAHVIVLNNISKALDGIAVATRQHVTIGLVGFGLSEALLLLLLWKPMSRLRATSNVLPQLAQGGYQDIRNTIVRQRNAKWLLDEVDVLDRTTVALSVQLQELETQVLDRSTALEQRMHELQRERDFITRLLNTAQVIILTQDIHGNIVMSNEYLRSVTNYSPEAINSRPFMDLLHPDYVSSALQSSLHKIRYREMEKCYHESGLIVRNGEPRDIAWLHSCLSSTSEDDPVVLSIGLDITERKKAEQRLSWLAEHDSLTGLFNRRRFQQDLEQAIAISRRYKRPGAILFVDLDQFKYINDTKGHQSGDALLKTVASNLSRLIRDTDVIARLGGDEFGILLRETNMDGAIRVSTDINAMLSRVAFTMEGRAHKISASIGITLFPEHGTDPHDLLAYADLAMYQAKELGRNGWHMYSVHEKAKERLDARMQWEQKVEEAIESDRFVLYYQPILDLKTGSVSRYEALMRAIDQDGSILSPASIISTAERLGLIHKIDHIVLRKAISQIRALNEQGRHVQLSVNLSAKAFEDSDLVPALEDMLKQDNVQPVSLIFELTETAAVADFGLARNMMTSLRKLGCRFALDDFGVGFSSFFYLKQLPVDYIKIDGSFIRNLDQDMDDRTLVKAMSDVATGFGKKTIAEFVENADILQLLRELRVDFAQGYHIGKPLPPEQVFS